MEIRYEKTKEQEKDEEIHLLQLFINKLLQKFTGIENGFSFLYYKRDEGVYRLDLGYGCFFKYFKRKSLDELVYLCIETLEEMKRAKDAWSKLFFLLRKEPNHEL